MVRDYYAHFLDIYRNKDGAGSKLMKPKVYLETSFISCLTAKLSRDLTVRQRQLASKRWWQAQRKNFDLFVSQTIYEEIWQGDPAAAPDRSVLLEGIPLLALSGPYSI